MSDLIDRQAAIDAFWKLDVELRPSAMDAVVDMLKSLPTAEPNRASCKQVTGKLDLIDRQDAIKTIKDADVFVAYHEKDPIDEAVDEAIRATKRSVIYDIEMLPSAELEIIHCKKLQAKR